MTTNQAVEIEMVPRLWTEQHITAYLIRYYVRTARRVIRNQYR